MSNKLYKLLFIAHKFLPKFFDKIQKNL